MKQSTLTMKLVVLTTLLIHNVFSLSFVHQQNAEPENTEAKQAYLDAMIQFEKQLGERVNRLEKIAQNTLDKAGTLWEKDNLERVVYQYGLNQQRQVLITLRDEQNDLIDAKAYECRNLTQEEIDGLKKYADALKVVENQEADFYGNCTRQEELRFLVSNIKLTAESLDKRLSNVCYPPKVILPDKNIINFDAIDNYVLGGKTLEEYQSEVKDTSDQFTLITCSAESPYVIEQSCQNCDGIYNISSQQCLEGCPTNTHYEEEKKQCIDNYRVLNLEENDGNYIYGDKNEDEITKNIQLLSSNPEKTTICPPETPYANTNQECIKCEEGQVFDLSISECIVCPEGSVFNQEEHVCDPKTPITIASTEEQCVGSRYKWNGTFCVKCEEPGYFEDNKCICPDSYFYNEDRLECRPREEICPVKEEDKFYWNGSVCIKCNFPGTFIYESLTCQCQEGYTYNFDLQKCIFGNGTIVKVPNIAQGNNWIYGESQEEGYLKQIKQIDASTYSEECPSEAPYPNTQGVCVTCGVGELYDLSSKTCMKCPQETKLDQQAHQCLTEWQIAENKCPDQTPFWNGTSCIKCQQPGTLVSHVCHCPENYHYEWETLECIKNEKKFIPNFSDKDWIYGSLDESSLEKQNRELSAEYILEKCPVETPFPSNSGDCINCPTDRIFDISTGFCTVCPAGQQLNSETHSCVQKAIVQVECPEALPFYDGTNCIKCQQPGNFDQGQKKCICPEKYRFNSQTQVCQRIPSSIQNSNENALNYYGERTAFDSFLKTCPEETPFFDGAETCIACQYPNYFNFDNLKCEVCENDLIFDIATKSCITQQKEAPKKYNSLITNIKNYCCGATQKDEKLESCPPEKPFFNNAECVECKSPAYFNFATYKCQFCSDGKTFSEIVKKCVQNKYLETQTVSNLEGAANYHGEPPQIDSSYLKVNTCPKENPFFDGQVCLKCELPNYFDFNTKRCYSCFYRYQFSVQEKKCIPKKKVSGYKNNYLVGIENFAGAIPAYDYLYETCEAEAPFFNGSQCIKCEMPSFFNMVSRKCENCPEKHYFNTINKQCQYSDQSYITNIKANNIYYNGNYQEIIKFYQTKKEGNPDLKDCPEDTPFYQAREGKCINCPEDHPLFDMKYNECIQCGEGSYFSAEKHVCISTGKVAPTVERFIMNIFG